MARRIVSVAAMPIAALAMSLALAGCGASLPGMTTGSLFGGSSTPEAPKITNDPVARAIQVGTTSARALKCGYNFDPVKLRTNFIASETALNPADGGKVAQIYDTAFNGITKAVATQSDAYCSAAKTTKIKEALNRHLVGDYTPAPPEPMQEEDSLFGSWGSSSGSSSSPNFKPSTANDY